MDEKDREYFLNCGIKSGWHDKSLSTYTNDEEALRCIKNYFKKLPEFYSEGIGVYLWGSNGTGKSHLMNCSFMNLIKRGYTVRVFSMDELVDKFTSSWTSDEEKDDLNKTLRKVKFLGIDEFGKNVDGDGKPMPLPDFVKRIIESVIRYRVQMRLPLWITSNTDPKFVRDVFSEDVASLLREAVIPVCVTGGDYRKTLSLKNKKRLL